MSPLVGLALVRIPLPHFTPLATAQSMRLLFLSLPTQLNFGVLIVYENEKKSEMTWVSSYFGEDVPDPSDYDRYIAVGNLCIIHIRTAFMSVPHYHVSPIIFYFYN